MINSGKIWRLDKHIRFRRLFDEGVLIHQDKAEAMVVNDTALSFLENCDGVRNAGEIMAEIRAQFDVEEQQLLEDLEPFISELIDDGIIHAVDTQP